MFYMMSCRVKDNQWTQLGIVYASSIQAAADKIGATIFDVSPIGIWAALEDDYYLEEYAKITALPHLQRK